MQARATRKALLYRRSVKARSVSNKTEVSCAVQMGHATASQQPQRFESSRKQLSETATTRGKRAGAWRRVEARGRRAQQLLVFYFHRSKRNTGSSNINIRLHESVDANRIASSRQDISLVFQMDEDHCMRLFPILSRRFGERGTDCTVINPEL